jgi:hypothetical protein
MIEEIDIFIVVFLVIFLCITIGVNLVISFFGLSLVIVTFNYMLLLNVIAEHG